MFTLLHKGSETEAYFLFHGTGGNHFQLLRVMEELNPNATIIGVNATVGKGKQRRYFAELTNGELNKENFAAAVNTFMHEWEQRAFSFEKMVFLGYSNGANFILGLLAQNPRVAAQVILLHPANLAYHFTTAAETSIIMTSGATDTLALPGDVLQLKETMSRYFQRINYLLFDGGHELSDKEIKTIKGLLHTN